MDRQRSAWLAGAALVATLAAVYLIFRAQAAYFSVAAGGGDSCAAVCAAGGGRPSRRGAAAVAQADVLTGAAGPLGAPNGGPVYCRCRGA